MTNYPPELIEDFGKKFPPPFGVRYNAETGRYESSKTSDDGAVLVANMLLAAFAHNWHRVRELEEALRPFAKMHCNDDSCDCHNCVARKLLEKGNE